MNDPWAVLRRFTQARIGLGRCGSGLPTAALLEFQLAHAQARDAVHVPWDLGRFAEEVRGLGVEPVTVESAISDRGEYLRRPDLGRQLSQRSRERLAGLAGPMDVVLIVTNGLSSTAVERHGLPLLSAVLLALRAREPNDGPVSASFDQSVLIEALLPAPANERARTRAYAHYPIGRIVGQLCTTSASCALCGSSTKTK